MIPVRHFYMIRHGETEANANQIMAGSLDSPLTENGRAQARAIHDVIDALKIKPRRIVHSHLERARETAEIINDALNVPMHEDPDYAELHTGDWEGVHYDECRDLLRGWVDPPGGERYAEFFERIKRAKKRALKGHEPVMAVTHGGVFRAFLKLHGIHKTGVRNCMLYEFEPATNLENGNFPWTVWRYDIKETVTRTQVDLQNHPASEIA